MVMERVERVNVDQLIAGLDDLVAKLVILKEQLARLRPPVEVIKWAQRVNQAINDPALSPEERMKVVEDVPAPLRHAVAAECYRTNENVTFGWVAAIAGVLSFEAPDLLRAYGVEPEFTTDMRMTAEEMDEEIAALEARGVLK